MPLKPLTIPVLTALFMTTQAQAAPEHNLLSQNGHILVQTRAHAEAPAEVHIANVYGKSRAIQHVINKQNGTVLRLTHGR
ncbi:hypothetical protein [Kingella oralis]|jgi:hypothetical protein|uniref:hypothetical protein n=1 Tax=Kingella oralis TaxID=505 RepID=UPI0028E63C60|nr:hypothetical protein [Kingella oralis]